jgi:hypothetical protein
MVAVPAPTPITIPVPEPTAAIAILLLLQLPPGAGSVNVAVPPAQILEAPLILPALAAGLTETVEIAVQLPMAYVIVALPAPTPVTVPLELPIVATPVLPLVQVPPPTAFVSVVVLPRQTFAVAGAIAAGVIATVAGFIATQPEAFTNEIFTVPADNPVTIPVADPTVATEVLPLIHVPPPTSVSVVVDPTQMLTAPGGDIAEGFAFTVTVDVVVQLPMA